MQYELVYHCLKVNTWVSLYYFSSGLRVNFELVFWLFIYFFEVLDFEGSMQNSRGGSPVVGRSFRDRGTLISLSKKFTSQLLSTGSCK